MSTKTRSTNGSNATDSSKNIGIIAALEKAIKDLDSIVFDGKNVTDFLPFRAIVLMELWHSGAASLVLNDADITALSHSFMQMASDLNRTTERDQEPYAGQYPATPTPRHCNIPNSPAADILQDEGDLNNAAMLQHELLDQQTADLASSSATTVPLPSKFITDLMNPETFMAQVHVFQRQFDAINEKHHINLTEALTIQDENARMISLEMVEKEYNAALALLNFSQERFHSLGEKL